MRFFDKVGGVNPVGHYSTAVVLSNGFLFLSGQVSIDESGNIVGDTVSEQTKNILKNVSNILLEVGYSKENIISVTVYISDMSKFPEFNEEYKKFFGDHKPTRTTVGVNSLPKGALVEISIIAFRY